MARKPNGLGTGIREVAQLAGVSPSTVSRVLNDKMGGVKMSPATIERIRAAAITLHYQPNAAARSLRTTRAQTVGVIARNLLHPFIAELLRALSTGCRARGYHLLLGNAEQSTKADWMLGDILSADRVDGVLLLGDLLSDPGREEEMQRIIQRHGHVVTVGGHPSVAGEVSILVDDQRGVELAMDYLVAQGHRSIGYISQSIGAESWEDRQRRSAYRRFLKGHNLPWSAEAELVVTNRMESSQDALRTLRTLANRPTAVFVANDVTALVTIKAALESGLRVPGDLSVVGFDDIPFSALCTPGLTTIRQPIDVMGRHAAGILLDRITGTLSAERQGQEIPTSNTLIFPPTLVCRESACPPP
ncbi:MAG: LacI family DNA-binding transcriptional regulator [Chloroflexota bacterium]